MKVVVLLHPTCHPKETSRKRLQMMFNEACNEKFKDMLNIDKCMIACHNPDNIRRLITPSSLKKCRGMENSAKNYACEARISTMDNEIGIVRRTKETFNKEKITPRRIEITHSQLQNSGTLMHHSACNRKIIFRQER